jgi:hypothetical protein
MQLSLLVIPDFMRKIKRIISSQKTLARAIFNSGLVLALKNKNQGKQYSHNPLLPYN